ncbi:MAG: Do family serine endopeptidase [Candidatus Marinimicrobia bacterium]|nr:Do family serine endopeptidase [Candidatus Neomarinimicrobiota bacterium]
MKKWISLLIVVIMLAPLGAQDLKSISDQFVEVTEKVSPSVVTITAQKITKVTNPFGDLDLPFEFFGFNVPKKEQEFRSSALGSGVIVHDGYVITNNHVIKDAEEIKVVLSDKREYEAELIGGDSKTDIAILKIDEKKLPTAKLGDSDKLQVGEWVLAIGSPYSARLGNTVTHGIISGLGRSGMQLSTYESYIQTDAPINPGNSGGALVNLDGEVIGINSAILSRSGGSNGIGFAIPIDLAKKVMNDIIKEGRVIRAWLGVSIQELNQDLSESLGIDDIEGVLIADVVEDSPAEAAKLQAGDVIIKVNDDKVNTPSELQLNISSRVPGENVKLTFVRNKKTKIVSVKLDELPGEKSTSQNIDVDTDINLGFSVRENNNDIAQEYGLDFKKGVVVVKVVPGSEAQRKGLRVGDRIVTLEGKNINDMDDYKNAFNKIEKNQTVLILIETKNGVRRFFTTKAK